MKNLILVVLAVLLCAAPVCAAVMMEEGADQAYQAVDSVMVSDEMPLMEGQDVSGTDNISATIKQVVLNNMEAMKQEDLEAMLKTIHSQSPSYMTTKQQAQGMFDAYDLKYGLTYYKFIGQDKDVAVARVRQTTEKVEGGAFLNNEIDMIQVFKNERGIWKYWTQAIMAVKYLN